MSSRPEKITFAEMRESGVRGPTIIDHRERRSSSSRASMIARNSMGPSAPAGSVCDVRGHKMSPPQTNATPMTIKAMPRARVIMLLRYLGLVPAAPGGLDGPDGRLLHAAFPLRAP